MELLLERKYLKAAYTIGCLSFDGTRFCANAEYHSLRTTPPTLLCSKLIGVVTLIPYTTLGRTLIKARVSFDATERNIGAWKVVDC